jgi:hypothetical protein
LKYCGLDFNDENIKHVQFEGLDFDVSSMPYGASVEAKAVSVWIFDFSNQTRLMSENLLTLLSLFMFRLSTLNQTF